MIVLFVLTVLVVLLMALIVSMLKNEMPERSRRPQSMNLENWDKTFER